MKTFKKIFLPCVCLAIVVLFAWLCLEDLFSDVALEQMLWHVQNAELLKEGYTSPLVVSRYILSAIFYCALAVFLFVYDGRIARFASSVLARIFPGPARAGGLLRFFQILQVAAGILALAYLGHFVPEIYRIIRMHADPDSVEDNAFIAEHYENPGQLKISFPDGKRNLVCVLVESMENTYGDLVPQLAALHSEGSSNGNMIAVHGTTWTIAAQTAWFFGLPLKTPLGVNRNRYISKDGFLPGAISVFDILAQNGYKCVLVMGTDAFFGGAELLFTRHGSFEIRDKKYFVANGADLEQNRGTRWGFSDAFVLKKALEAYRELVTQNQPFVLFVATMDTHSPDGYAPPDARKFGDIRDAIIHADRNVAGFVRAVMSIREKHDRLALCVIGDHEYMGELKFVAPETKRRLYNLFYGNIPPLPENRREAPVSALDMAPTLLQMAGGRWQNAKFGLGVSIFSSGPTLLEKFGEEKLDYELARRSKFYESFY